MRGPGPPERAAAAPEPTPPRGTPRSPEAADPVTAPPARAASRGSVAGSRSPAPAHAATALRPRWAGAPPPASSRALGISAALAGHPRDRPGEASLVSLPVRPVPASRCCLARNFPRAGPGPMSIQRRPSWASGHGCPAARPMAMAKNPGSRSQPAPGARTVPRSCWGGTKARRWKPAQEHWPTSQRTRPPRLRSPSVTSRSGRPRRLAPGRRRRGLTRHAGRRSGRRCRSRSSSPGPARTGPGAPAMSDYLAVGGVTAHADVAAE